MCVSGAQLKPESEVMLVRRELYQARKSAGLTQEQVANEVGIDRTLYNKIERGKQQNVPVDVAIKIAKLVNRPVENIFLPFNVQEMHNDKKSIAG